MAATVEETINTLKEMGFSEEQAKKALAETNWSGVEAAAEWLLSHVGDDDDDDDDDVVGKVAKDDDDGKEDAAAAAPKKELTAEEREEQLKRLEELRVRKRKEREERERQDEVEREKRRVQDGKAMTSLKHQLQEMEMKKIAEERRREKQETRLAKERVKAQIAQDRAARVQKDAEQNLALGAASGRGPAQTSSQPPAIPVAGSDKSSSSSEVEYSETRLQIRQIDGTPLVQTFKAKEPLSAVRLYVQMNRKDIPGGPVKLMTAFPRKVFEEEDYQQPLASLGLVPSAVLIISR